MDTNQFEILQEEEVKEAKRVSKLINCTQFNSREQIIQRLVLDNMFLAKNLNSSRLKDGLDPLPTYKVKIR